MTLWYLANQETFRQCADRFNVSESTAHGIITLVVQHLVDIRSTVIKWHDDESARRNEHEFFKKQNLHGVLGTIDCSHILINKPNQNQEVYCNRKGTHSILLQGIVDYKKRFLDVFCGEAGSLHDARVLRRSVFYQKALNGHINFRNRYLLGDSAYPTTLNWLVTPFKDNGNLTPQHHIFNFKHSSTRIVIENAFALLKGRFRRLRHFDNRNISFIVKCTVAACVLHNICIDAREDEAIDIEEVDEGDMEEMEDNDNILENARQDNETRRQQLFNELFNI